jgi:hypothetical protein
MIHEAHQVIQQTVDEVLTFQEHTVLIGDSWRDLEAAAACNIDCRILVSTGYGLECMKGTRPSSSIAMDPIISIREINTDMERVLPFFYTENLSSAVTWILEGRYTNYNVQ